MNIQFIQDLKVYQAAFELQQAVYHESKRWPKDETYLLTDQVRRSSRSIGANLSEAWAQRRYPAHFLSKLTDADAELLETQHWIETAAACAHLSEGERLVLIELIVGVGRRLGAMLQKHDQFCLPAPDSA